MILMKAGMVMRVLVGSLGLCWIYHPLVHLYCVFLIRKFVIRVMKLNRGSLSTIKGLLNCRLMLCNLLEEHFELRKLS